MRELYQMLAAERDALVAAMVTLLPEGWAAQAAFAWLRYVLFAPMLYLGVTLILLVE